MEIIGIHVVHRRMAEIQLAAAKVGFENLSVETQQELYHCLQVNCKLIQRLDELKQLSQVAYAVGDMDWIHDICGQIDKLQATFS